MKMTKRIQAHQIIRVDLSNAVQAHIDTFDDAVAVRDNCVDNVMAHLEREWNTLPDINAIYTYQIVLADDSSVWALCKIRTFKKDSATAGWFMAVVTHDEYGKLLLANIEDRDAVILSILDLKANEIADKWVAHY